MDETINNLRPDYTTGMVKMAMANMFSLAMMSKSEFITPEHLLISICGQPEFILFCKEKGIDRHSLEKEISNYLDTLDTTDMGENKIPMLSILLLDLFEKLSKHQTFDRPTTVPEVLHQLWLTEGSFSQYLLTKYFTSQGIDFLRDLNGIYRNDYHEYFSMEVQHQDSEESNEGISWDGDDVWDEDFMDILDNDEAFHDMQAEWKKRVTSVEAVLEHQPPLVGREKELDRTIRILCRKDKNNPLFIGEPGVGKTAMVYGLAKRIAEGNVPKRLQKCKIYALDFSSLIAGAAMNGEFEKRIKEILDGATQEKDAILYIDDIHTILGTNGGNNNNATDILKPYLEGNTLRFIGCTTYKDYNNVFSKSKTLARRFENIDIKEPDTEETIKIIKQIISRYEKHHGVTYTPEAIEYAVRQSDAYINDRFLPDKAIDIIDEAGALRQHHPFFTKSGKMRQRKYQTVTVETVKEILIDVCRIDAKALGNEGNEGLKNLEKNISQEIYGQDEAIRQVVRSVMMAKAGLSAPDKPLASLLFVGPTGVGKTEVCKVLARELGIELIRYDMSEYAEKHTVSKLIGSPAGYVGYEDGGLLTDAIRQSPNCVLLLDEIEKAHTDIYNILLQVMDYAQLTDSKGNKANFRNVILIMTSNAGAQYAGQASIGFSGGLSKGEAMMNTVRKIFKPEFINRLSATIVFNDMSSGMAEKILLKKLHILSKRMEEKNAAMTLTDEARQLLLEKGFSEKYGAREMDRVIQQYLTPILMEEILFGKLKDGGEITITRHNDTLMSVSQKSKQ